MRPLFVPLKTEHFRAFACGEKQTEYRAYGPRWNERTCIPGRPVTLSHGYSGARIDAVVSGFRIVPRSRAPATAQALYPVAERIAAISVDISR